MAEKAQQQGYPLAPANGYARSDAEASRSQSDDELRRQKRKKWALYIIAFVIFQTGVIVFFSMTVMKFRTPKFRVRPANSFETFDVQTSSFNLRMNTQLGVKNTNFGPFKYGNSTVYFYYRGTQVGSAIIPKSKANFRRTKKVNIAIDLITPTSQASNSELAADVSSGIVPLTSTSRLSGKIEIMFIFKKKKSVNMNCTMELNISAKQLQNIKCK
ncbi:Late embryogenesis abundant protein [Actinidia chinensis var. chinensis]|uniref:Late embryogenesis abundant protein n=1 Tax=Actinidia chinensis var. chinensis TaxID=1590841 RepID=A0A2R6Q937_ACTCC|nr:Late embryogenesis abundant protein [Actinidia chinensis var. chinensis]